MTRCSHLADTAEKDVGTLLPRIFRIADKSPSRAPSVDMFLLLGLVIMQQRTIAFDSSYELAL